MSKLTRTVYGLARVAKRKLSNTPATKVTLWSSSPKGKGLVFPPPPSLLVLGSGRRGTSHQNIPLPPGWAKGEAGYWTLPVLFLLPPKIPALSDLLAVDVCHVRWDFDVPPAKAFQRRKPRFHLSESKSHTGGVAFQLTV